jgi:pyruvate kinase
VRKTKIIATLGPASSSDAAIRELIDAGVDVFRFNFSHGTHESHGATIARVRQAATQTGRLIGLLQDLSGPKIRTGWLRGHTPVPLTRGERLTIGVGDFEGEPGHVSTTFDLPRVVRPGDCLLLDDGRLQLRVEKVTPGELQTTVVDGGPLGEHKGINVPGVEFPPTGLTDKDIADLQFGAKQGVDFVALSFVQSAAVLRQARDLLRTSNAPEIPLVAKLERPEAITRLDEILQASDAVMVARGDLGLELPLERVPRVQKEITRRGRALEVPVVVATQVLESMRTAPRPTRAEVSDAANAVEDGVDAIMLAGETAAGEYPVKAVQTLDAIIREAESIPPVRHPITRTGGLVSPHAHAVCEAAITLAESGDAAAIVAVTRGGKTARVLSALRPQAPIYAASDDAAVLRCLSLVWGVVPTLTDLADEVNATAARIGNELVTRGAIAAGSVIVVVSITDDISSGRSNFVKLQRV